MKWNRIVYKRTLADCAVDGVLPFKNLATRSQAMKELVVWLNRLNRNVISIAEREDLKDKLLLNDFDELSRRQRQISISEFSRLNNIFNNSKSETMHKKVQQEPQILKEYHDRLDEVRKHWPFDPVNVIATKINGLRLPAHIIMKLVIGDFGCGRAKLAELLKENEMYNFDHHDIISDKITVCDMKSVPLKYGQLDVAVFCLSLMEENWPDYIIEAKRCLAKNGLLFIAETTKSLIGRLSNLRDMVKECGFEIYSDEERGVFTFIDARKL